MKKLLAGFLLLAALSGAAQARDVAVVLESGVTRRGELAGSGADYVALRFRNGKVRRFSFSEVGAVIDKETKRDLLPGMKARAAGPAGSPAAAASEPEETPAGELGAAEPPPAPAAPEAAPPASQPAPPPAEEKKAEPDGHAMHGLSMNIVTGLYSSAYKQFGTYYEDESWPPPVWGMGFTMRAFAPTPKTGFYLNGQVHSFKAKGVKPAYSAWKWEQTFTDYTMRYQWTKGESWADDWYWIGAGPTSTKLVGNKKTYSGFIVEGGLASMNFLVMSAGYRSIDIETAGAPTVAVGGFYVMAGIQLGVK